MRIKRVRPGDEVAAYCGRCKDERTHQAIALNSDGEPATVICRTCNEQHRYRPRRETAARGAGAASAKPAGRARTESKTNEARPVSARAYSPRESFAEGEWLEHPKFGVGRVTSSRAGKVEVKFDGDTRLLVHAGEG